MRTCSALAALMLLGLAACEDPVQPRRPALAPDASPEPRERLGAETLDDDDCQACHPRAAEQWALSRHHSAFTNPDFARSFAREPTDFCRNCHAPALIRPAESRLEGEAAHQLGVGCLDCHVDPREPSIVQTGGEGPSEAPHMLERSLDFGTRSCASCHEFSFPEGNRRPVGTMMQLTMTEHRRSAHADQTCSSCHMPAHDHGFASVRDEQRLRAAVQISATREANTLVLALSTVGVGHAFPTGDLYRRLEVHAELRDPDNEQVLAGTTRYLARQFAPWRFANGALNPAWHEPVPDDRLTDPTELRLELDDPHSPRAGDRSPVLVWWVDYERVDQRVALRPERSTLASELRLASGRL